MMQIPLQRLLFDKGNGNGHDWTPTQNEVQEMFSQVTNAYFVREGILSKWMDPRRDYDKECGYPETTQITAEIFRRIYERDPIGRRVIRFLPEECWQKPPEVYEDDDPNVLTEFETAWQDLSRSMRTPSGQTWYADQEGSAIWEAMIRLDVLSRVGQYGVMLLGFDDGQDLSLPVRGVEEEGSVPVLQEFDAKGQPQLIENERGLRVPKLDWPLGTWEQAGCPSYSLTVNKDEVRTGEGKKASLKYLRVFPEDLAQVVQWEVNQNSPRYGHPSMYMINQSDPYVGVSGVGQSLSTLRVHWTRVLHVADNRDSSDTNGSPACRPVYNRLLDLTKLYGGSAEMYWAGAFPGISAETHPQLGGDVAIDKTEFRAQMKSWYNSLQRWLGMSGMSFKMLSPTVVDPKSQIDVQLQAICILLGVPLRIFMGSERGELASNMDDTTWTDRVRFRLHSHLTPHLIVPFVDRLIWLGVLPEPKAKKKGDKGAKPGYYVTWPDLKVLSPQQKATVAQLITQCLATYVQSGLMDLIEPLTYLTKVVGWDEKEARAYIEATLEEMKARNPDVPEEDLHVGVPPQPPMDQFGTEGEGGFGGPEGGPEAPEGEGGFDWETEEELESEEEPTTQEATDNAWCATGEGGGKDNSCSSKGSGRGELDFTLPPASDDPSPGGKYWYHGTSGSALSKIADSGLRPGSKYGAISVAPHIESVRFWIDAGAGSTGAKGIALLRIARRGTRPELEETTDDYDPVAEGDQEDFYDPYDPTAENRLKDKVIPPDKLEVYVGGMWKPLRDLTENILSGNDKYGSWEPVNVQVASGIVFNTEGKPRKLNNPFRTPGGPKKFAVYVKGPKGTVIKVSFGDPNMKIKRGDPGRRKNFRARHGCDDPGPKWKARYWACKTWEKGKTVGDVVNRDPTDNTFFSECERDDEGRCKAGGGSSRPATSGRGPRSSKPPEATAKRPTSTRGASKGRSRARGTGRETAKGTAGCAKCDRAKQAHVMIAKGDQARAEKNEKQVAKIVGGLTFKDSEPADVVIGSKNQVTGGVEVKSILKGKNDKITMDSYAQVRKLDWEKRNKAPFHTVIVDDRDPKARKLYYRRGVAGSARLGSLHLVKNAAELKALVVANEKSLPEKARRTDNAMRQGSWKPVKGERAFKNTKTGKIVRAKK